jgi:Na+/melibiose symporter-like transporter
MSLVEDRKRGIFTANKENFSLISGTVLTFFMGNLVDYFTEKNDIRTAFIISALVIFGLMCADIISLFVAVEKKTEPKPKISIKKTLIDLFHNKDLRIVFTIFILYRIANHSCTPFYGSYQINELGFTMNYVFIISSVGHAVRIAISRFMGRYADKRSFAHMLEKCFLALACSFLCIVFTVPSNGKILFIIHTVFSSIAGAGVTSSLVNLVFDYADPEKRSDALAVSQAMAGLVGFFATLAVSPLVSVIQTNGNKFLGMNIYAQQLVSVIGTVFILIAAVYIRIALIKKKK